MRTIELQMSAKWLALAEVCALRMPFQLCLWHVQTVRASSWQKVASASTVELRRRLCGDVTAPDTTCATRVDSIRRSTVPTGRYPNCSRRRFVFFPNSSPDLYKRQESVKEIQLICGDNLLTTFMILWHGLSVVGWRVKNKYLGCLLAFDNTFETYMIEKYQPVSFSKQKMKNAVWFCRLIVFFLFFLVFFSPVLLLRIKR